MNREKKAGEKRGAFSLVDGIKKLAQGLRATSESGSLTNSLPPPRPRSPAPDFGVQPPPRPRSPTPGFGVLPPPLTLPPSPSGLLPNGLDDLSPSSSSRSSSNPTPRSSCEIMTPTATPRGSGGGPESSLIVDTLHTPRNSGDKVIETHASSGNPQGVQSLVQTPDADSLMSAQDQSRETDILTPPESPSGSPLPKEKRRHFVGMGENSTGFFSLTSEQRPKPKTEKEREAEARAELQRNTEEFIAARARNAEQQEEANVLAERFAVERKKFIAIHEERELVKEFKEAVINSRIQFSILNAEPLGSITNKFNHQANIVKNLIVVGLNILKKNIEEEFKELGVRLFMEGVDDPGLRIEKLKALGHRLEKLENIAQDVDAYMADKRAKEHKAESVDLQDETFAAALALVTIDSIDQDTQTDFVGMGW